MYLCVLQLCRGQISNHLCARLVCRVDIGYLAQHGDRLQAGLGVDPVSDTANGGGVLGPDLFMVAGKAAAAGVSIRDLHSIDRGWWQYTPTVSCH